MEYINPTQLSLIGNMSVDKAYAMICKANGKSVDEVISVDEKTKKVTKPAIEASVVHASAASGLNIEALIVNIANNFTKNQVCVEWAIKEVEKKIKPNKDGMMPPAITLPRIIMQLLNDPEYDRLKELIQERLKHKLTVKSAVNAKKPDWEIIIK